MEGSTRVRFCIGDHKDIHGELGMCLSTGTQSIKMGNKLCNTALVALHVFTSLMFRSKPNMVTNLKVRFRATMFVQMVSLRHLGRNEIVLCGHGVNADVIQEFSYGNVVCG